MTEIFEFVGKIFSQIITDENMRSITFFVNDGTKYQMEHTQDCCENVRLIDACGNMSDLVNSEILIAREDSNAENEPCIDCEEFFTWTFYNIATRKGWVTLRWLGESNGCYSEKVDIFKVEQVLHR